MIKRFILMASAILLLPSILFAGTLFEDTKKTSDPYISERGGFNSLFVNPAGAAGQSGFELSFSAGGQTRYNDIVLLTSVLEIAPMISDGGFEDVDVSQVSATFSGLYNAGIINDTMLNTLFAGTDLSGIDWSDPAAVQAAATTLAADSGQLTAVETNFEAIMTPGSTEAIAFFGAYSGVIQAEALATLKSGFLIKGFGMGIYDQAWGLAVVDPATGDYGVESLINELGVIAGGGFNLLKGKLALGFSGNYGVLMRNAAPISFDSAAFSDLYSGSGSVNYGYNWGVDLGAIWRPTPALGVGLVLNDIIGSAQTDMPYTADGLEGFISSGAYLMNAVDYQVTFDMDAGITWQPDWRAVQPKFSFDLYNVIGYGTDVAENGDDFSQAMYRALEHMRVGANFTFWKFLKLATQYYDHNISLGFGLDIVFMEFYLEGRINEEIFYTDDPGDVPFGADIMVRFHF